MGTNDLVHEGPEAVVMKMDDLIAKMKGNVKRIAVSSVIKRYDGRVAASSKTNFNNLVKSLCSQHDITFINNDHIDKSFLNRSKHFAHILGLTEMNQILLKIVFCDVYHHRKREWIRHLENVKQMVNH